MKPTHQHSSPGSGPGHTASHGSVTSYVVGFVLSMVLTLASFAAIMTDAVPHGMRLTAIVVLCVAQLVLQLVCFLHLGSAPGQRENTAVFVCTALLIAIVVAGSLWVMHNANVNMMPMQMTKERAMAHD